MYQIFKLSFYLNSYIP